MRLRTQGVMAAGLLALALAVSPAGPARADDAPLEVKLVDVMNALYGKHAGYRANHAKGAVFEGTFTPAPTASALSSAVHLQSTAVPITVRFSNAGGLPDAPDTHPSALVRGMAIRFHLPDGSETDIVSITLPAFPVATGDDFLALLQAVATSGPDAPKPSPLEKFLGAHPATAKALTTPLRIPVSYATIPFYGINSFRFTNAQGVSKFGRYQIIPTAGAAYLSEADAAKAAPNFLAEDVRKRLATGPVTFRLQVQLAGDGDAIIDPSTPWPADRPTVELGTIAITKAVANSDEAQKALLFLPTNLTAGIEPSDDPMIALRSAAYAVSYGRRTE